MSIAFRSLSSHSASPWHSGGSVFKRLPRRCFSFTAPARTKSKLDLPPENEWRKHFPNAVRVSHRVSLRNAETAAKLADAFVPEGSEGKVIVEAFPGPGQLSRALLNLPKKRIKKIIILEDWEPFLEYLRPLQEADPRVIIVDKDGYNWDSYQLISEQGLLDDVPKLEWDQGLHPSLQFISHLPSTVAGEQLISQFLRTVPERQWLFQYGRVPLSFLLSEHVYKRVVATPQSPASLCKVSIVASAVASLKPALPFPMLQPYDHHFHPVSSAYAMSADMKKSSRAVGLPFASLQVEPLEEQLIRKGETDMWDYCLRRLFVRKATELKTALPGLAPGAQTLVKKLTDPTRPDDERLDVRKKINQLEARDWAVLLKAFADWPFKPEDLSIGDFQTRTGNST